MQNSFSSIQESISFEKSREIQQNYNVSSDNLPILKRLGQHHDEMKEWIATWFRPGISYIELTERIESEIARRELKAAFPVCIAVNNCAAHDLARHRDVRIFEGGDFCKIDFGIQENGLLIDSAYTYVLPEIETELDLENNKNKKKKNHEQRILPDIELRRGLIDCGREAVATGLKHCGIDAILGEIGGDIQEVVESYGYKTCSDLSGHSIMPYRVHGKKAVPNIRYDYQIRIKEGDYLSFEPFVTSGSGKTYTTMENDLFMFNYFQYSYSDLMENPRNFGLNPGETQFMRNIYDHYYTLAFSKRWIQLNPAFQNKSKNTVNGSNRTLKAHSSGVNPIIQLSNMTKKNYIVKFPPIYQEGEHWVVQFEDNVYIKDEKVERISRSHDLNINISI